MSTRFGYPNIKVGKLSNEQNIQNTKAFLYANVLRDRDNIPEIFRDYEVQIKMFAKIQLKEMHIDKNLKYLYEWIWNDSLTTDETTALSAFKLQFMWEIAIDLSLIHI